MILDLDKCLPDVLAIIQDMKDTMLEQYDHLDGILFPQWLKDLRYFGFEDELDYLSGGGGGGEIDAIDAQNLVLSKNLN